MHATLKFEISPKVLGKVVNGNQNPETPERRDEMIEETKPQNELEKLKSIFEKVDPNKQKLVEKLIQEAAFLADQNDRLRTLLQETGMIKIHPTNPALQKSTAASKQYLKNLQAYSVVIKTLSQVLTKSTIEDEDEFENFLNDEEDE